MTEILDTPAWRTRSHAHDSAGVTGEGNPSEGPESNVRQTKLEGDAEAVVPQGGRQFPMSGAITEMSQENAGRVEGDGCDVMCGNPEGVLGGGSCLGDGAKDSKILRLARGSVLKLRDGGYAPGEEQCSRDEEL